MGRRQPWSRSDLQIRDIRGLNHEKNCGFCISTVLVMFIIPKESFEVHLCQGKNILIHWCLQNKTVLSVTSFVKL